MIKARVFISRVCFLPLNSTVQRSAAQCSAVPFRVEYDKNGCLLHDINLLGYVSNLTFLFINTPVLFLIKSNQTIFGRCRSLKLHSSMSAPPAFTYENMRMRACVC